jgi:predicted transcriptional regulator
MDTRLAEAFAVILERIWDQPWLGNATTGELLDEIKARVNLDYKTVNQS